jgi:murein L,D-transpeptidase YafK
LKSRPYSARTLVASAAIAAALALGGCKTEGAFPVMNARANAPIPPKLLAAMEEKNMPKESPLLVRVFKQEAELEVWKQDRTGRYALLKTYPICRWSGDLGPKIQEGDRQAPEGFYNITPGQMNPNSQFYLAFNLGYPNAFDRAHGRTGAHLMVHGDCSSRGCYAMTDEQISEIFALGRESFFAGQQSFQVQAYPFRMSPANMARHRANPHMAFWKMLKQGYDHFEVTRLEPKVDVCEKRYVFNAGAPENSSTPVSFNPAGRCPVYEVPQEVAAAVQDKQRKDEFQTAQLISRGGPVAPVKSGRDGGMHPTFVAALKPQEIVDEKGNIKLIVDKNPPPGVMATAAYSPPVVEQNDNIASTASITVADVPLPRNAPQPKVGARPEEPSFADRLANFFKPGSTGKSSSSRVAAVEPAPQQQSQPQQPARQGGVMNRMFSNTARANETKPAADSTPKESVTSRISRKLGLRGSEGEETAPTPKARPATAKPGAIEPRDPSVKTAAAGDGAPAPNNGGLLNGAQPIPQSSSFDSRWGAVR